MKKIIAILTLAITLTSCASEPEFILIEKITDSDKNYTVKDWADDQINNILASSNTEN